MRERGVGEEFPRAVAEGESPRFADGEIVLPIERVRTYERLTSEQWEQVRAVEGAVAWGRNAGERAGGGEEIEVADRFCVGGTGGDVTGPADDAGDPVAGFGDVEFHAAQRAGRTVTAVGTLVALERFGAVVAGEIDEGVVAEAVIVEVAEELADGGVHLRSGAEVVAAVGVFLVGIEGEKFLRGGDRLVGFVKPEV